MRNGFYPKLAAQSLRQNRRFYLPYLLALVGLTAAFYVMAALGFDEGLLSLRGFDYVRLMMYVGMVVAGLFSAVLLLYVNSFLMKRRKRELGLYNILGMGKGDIARLQCWESLYTAVIGVGGGLLCGAAFYQLAVWALKKLLKFSVPFGSALSLPAAGLTAAVFTALLALTLLVDLGKVGLTSPVELFRGGDVGEREPKTRWLLAALGVLTLGSGYVIAVCVIDPIMALAVYFLAVVLVIVGTYCLFTAGSIALLKLLRKNKRFYYQTGHFIGVSGMLYRMKRNAVGLASICILSTMVMVMASGTISLYLGTGEIIDARYPADFQVTARYSEDEDAPFDGGALAELTEGFLAEQGARVTAVRSTAYLDFNIVEGENGDWQIQSAQSRTGNRNAYFITADDYAGFTGREAPALLAGQAAVCGEGISAGRVTLRTGDGGALALDVMETLPEIPFFADTFDNYETVCFILPDAAAVREVYALQRETMERDYRFVVMLDLDCGTEEALALENAWYDVASDPEFFAGIGAWQFISVSTRAEMEVEGYAAAGGFLFLGVLLGVIFLMATVLILYYKQMSEGYEDRDRFEIMRKVGLSQAQIRASVRSQTLLVFFLPILAAGVHLLFDFNLVVRLLSLFSVRNVAVIALCTGGTLLAFLAVYGAAYLLTARTYYKIVR